MDETQTTPIVVEETKPALSTPKPSAPRGLPKWEIAARDRLKSAVKKFSKPLAELVHRDANEGDTRLLITDLLCEGFGFDKYTEFTTEYRVKGEFADYGIRIDKQLTAFIEVKRVSTKLAERHLRQVEMYAVNEGVEWLILTNGVVWQVYHVTGGLPVIVELALNVDLLSDDSLPQKVNQLFYLTKESLKHKQIDGLWQAKRATSPKSLASVLRSPSVVDTIRKELKRKTGLAVANSDVIKLLNETILRPECLETEKR
jgi:predicted type IV restriction endonuclease